MPRARVRRSRSAALAALLAIALLGALAVPATATAGFGLVAKWGGSPGSGNGEFDGPFGITTDSAGSVYVADRDNYRIQKFTSTGGFLTKWGSKGAGNGQFGGTGFGYGPTDVATDAAGNVYVTDNGNNRIQKFTSNGAFLAKWGTDGTGPGQFSDPEGIATDATGNVYVGDSGNTRIQRFRAGGTTFVLEWNETPGPGFGVAAVGVDVGPAGNVYVAGGNSFPCCGGLVHKFTSLGTFLTEWKTEKFHGPPFVQDLATDPAGDVYVVDSQSRVIQKFSSNGTFIAKWGSEGSGDGQFRFPWGVATDAAGDIYVVNLGDLVQRVQKFHEVAFTVSAKKSQGVKKLKVKLSCPKVICAAKITGKAKIPIKDPGPKRDEAAAAAKTKSFKLSAKRVELEAGEKKGFRLKFRNHRKSVRKIARLIKRKGAKAKATIKVTDPPSGAVITARVKKLKA